MRHPDQISLETVLDEPLPFACELSFTVGRLDREPLLEISPVRLDGEVSRVEGGYSLAAHAAWGGKLECSRCLAAYPFEEAEEFSLLLYKGKAPQGVEVLLQPDDLDVLYYGEPVISLSPIAEERVQMAVPMKPLCREECRGLCPHCGSDLNFEPCDCSVEEVDPRWEALRSLKKV